MDKKIDDLRLSLGKRVKKVFDDDDFILSVLLYASSVERVKKVNDYLDQHPDAKAEDISLFIVIKNRGLDNEQ